MTEEFNIVELIEKNPITRLSQDYNNDLIKKIKNKFTDKEQQMFAGSFYCYLNYHSKNDFVVDLDDVWKWIGFTRKDNAKRLLDKFFVKDVDYKVSLHRSVGRSNVDQNEKEVFLRSEENPKSGRPEEQIMLTVNTFKKFCLKAGTKKADEIHDYYIKLEELLQETINEETVDLRNQMLKKNEKIDNLKKDLKKSNKQIEKDNEKHKLEVKTNRHNMLVEILKTKKCVYIGEDIYNKVGSSGNIDDRWQQLKRIYGNFVLLDVFECDHFREVDDAILTHQDVINNLYRDKINGHSSVEVVKLTDNFNYKACLTLHCILFYFIKVYIITNIYFFSVVRKFAKFFLC